MALFHLNVSSIGRSSGSSAVAAAAYRSCSQLNQYVFDETNGLSASFVHNYSNKKGLVFSQIFAPKNLASWCYDRQSLWNKVEESETRRDARFARDVKLALQKEFTLEQNIQILSEYVNNTFVKDGIIVDVNVHIDNENNPHAHIMLTTRKLIQNENGEWVFGNKNRFLDTKGWIKNIREEWAQINNHYFALYDIDKIITAESYETRGLGFLNTTIHEGAATHSENASEKVLDRTEHNRNVVLNNLEFIKANPTQVIFAIVKDRSLSSSVFNKESMLKAVDHFFNEIATRNTSYSQLIAETRATLDAECDNIIEKYGSRGLEDFLGDGVGFNSGYNKSLSETQYFNELLQNIRQSSTQYNKPFSIDDELEYIRSNRDTIIRSLNNQKAMFSKVDLAKLLDDYINKNIFSEIDNKNFDVSFMNEAKEKIAREYNYVLLNFMSSEELVKLTDKDLGGNALYTTKSQILLEKEFLGNLEELKSRSSHIIDMKSSTPNTVTSISTQNILSAKLANLLPSDARRFLEGILSGILGKKESYTLTVEQEASVKKILNSKDIVALSGMPGTGKSTVMERVSQEYRNRGYQVLGGSLSAVAALNLGNEANIDSYTLSKWQYDWELRNNLEEKGNTVRDLLPELTSKSVFIVDEMSMVDLKLANYITKKVKEAGAKLICIFDNNQFSPIGVGGASDKIAEEVEVVSLTELFRQRADLDKEVTKKLSNYRVDEAIKILDNEGRIKFGYHANIIRQKLTEQYIKKAYLNSSDSAQNSTAIIAYKNEEVNAINLQVRERLLSSGLLYSKHYNGEEKAGQEFVGARGKLAIAIDERIVFTKNNKHLGVLNGQIGKVIEILNESSFKVALLNEKSGLGNFKNLNNIVVINNEKFTHFDYGYAITAHKSQGKTYDYSYILLDSSVGYEAFNVMATRHRQNSEFYIDANILNDIILRKFDKSNNYVSSDVSLQGHENQLTNNHKAALYEMLVKRAPRSFAHDYIDYEARKEIVQLREYLNSRDLAAATYRELLKWQEAAQNEMTRDGSSSSPRIPNLWDNEELWNKFSQFTALRKSSAEEIIENYSLYQKYIDPTLINYSTLIKHAGKNSLAFDYQELANYEKQNFSQNIEDHNNITKTEALREYNEVVKLANSLAENYNKRIEKLLIAKAEGILSIHHEHQLNLETLSSKISALENERWLLESKKNACNYYTKDFIKYLDETYKQGGEKSLDSWKHIVKELGLKQAIEKIDNNPEMLGDLAGVGIGQKLAVTDKRAIAVFNLKTLQARISKYEESVAQAKDLGSQINTIETTQLAPLKETYNKLASSIILSKEKEDHLHDVINNKSNLKDWLKTQHESSNTQGHNQKEDSYISLDNSYKLQGKNSSIESKFSSYKRISYTDLHNKLCDNVIELTKDLLPLISNKNIEISERAIKCGSINISLEARTKGLWCRFSREDEKGDLFDLIRISKGLSNKQDAISWGKKYLGISITQSSINNSSNIVENAHSITSQEKLNKKSSLKILMPVPQDALAFKPEKVFFHKMKDGNKIIEEVYAYKNIENKLCGYVVRIQDLGRGTKETLPVVYTENSQGVKSWRSRGFGENRCLYNEHLLKDSTKPVLIVEGEKTADAAQKLYPEFDVVSWSGGSNGYNNSNWNVLKEKEVVIWPDNDQVGKKAAENIKNILEKNDITKAKIVDTSKIEFLPEKWDLADELPEDVRQYQVTGALLKVRDVVPSDQKIEKVLSDYIEHRKDEVCKAFSKTRINNLSEYIIRKEQISYQLKSEINLARKELLNKEFLSTTDEIFIAVDAEKESNKKLLKLDDNNMEKVIVNELADSYHNISKDKLLKISRIAISRADQIMAEHNSSQRSANASNTKDMQGNEHILSKNVLPVLALAFAERVINHKDEYNKNLEDALHKSADLNTNLSHAANIIKNSFKVQLTHDATNYELHNQQQLQRQIVQHMSHEI